MKQISLNKFNRISKLPETKIYIKLSIRSKWNVKELRFDICASNEVLLVNGEYLYEKSEIFKTGNGDNVWETVGVRYPLEDFSCKLTGAVLLDDLITGAEVSETKSSTKKLAISETF